MQKCFGLNLKSDMGLESMNQCDLLSEWMTALGRYDRKDKTVVKINGQSEGDCF